MVDMINAGKTFLGKKIFSTIVWAIYEARTDTWFKHWLSSEGLGCITGIKPPCPSEEYDAYSKQGHFHVHRTKFVALKQRLCNAYS